MTIVFMVCDKNEDFAGWAIEHADKDAGEKGNKMKENKQNKKACAPQSAKVGAPQSAKVGALSEDTSFILISIFLFYHIVIIGVECTFYVRSYDYDNCVAFAT